ncbi:MAG: hypothetical protein H6993_13605 [Pseudomonadales bacterium]|nr:hypothetical protein [Pseudomonadales bacterium]MCP5184996.1 hypothetical protein [Pseudomonadales bacterium]
MKETVAMNHLYTVTLVLNLLIELLAAVSLIGGPTGFAAAGSGEQWAMHYGFAALAISTTVLWVWPFRTVPAVATVVLGVLSTFHVGLFISLVTAGDQPAGVVIHAVMASLCLLLFVRRSRWCAA